MKCYDECTKDKKSCRVNDCRYWIEHSEDLNSTHIAIQKNGDMKLREVGERLNLTPSRIKQIESEAISKFSKRLKVLNII